MNMKMRRYDLAIINKSLGYLINCTLKVTVQFERCFQLMKHISVISCHNPTNLYITEKTVKFSKLLFNFYLVILNK